MTQLFWTIYHSLNVSILLILLDRWDEWAKWPSSCISNKLVWFALICIHEKCTRPTTRFVFCAVVARNPPADIRQVLAAYEGCDIPEEFIRRSKDHQR